MTENLSTLISVISTELDKLSKSNIENAVKLGYIYKTYKYNLPDCEICGNKLEFLEDSTEGKIYVCSRSAEHQKIFTEKELEKYSTMHLQTGVVIESFIEEIFDSKKIKRKKPLDNFNVSSYEVKLNDGWVFDTTFLLDKETDMAELGYLALQSSKHRRAWICFYNNTFFSAKKKEFYDLLSSIPLGMYVLSININNWFKKNSEEKGVKIFNDELETYRKSYTKIKTKEDKLLEDIKEKNLVYNVDTNPKLILTLAMRFRFDRSSLNWKDFENLAKVSFSIMYDSDLNVGGRPFKHESDFVFKYTENSISSMAIDSRRPITQFFGIGDTKLLANGKKLKLSDEVTEKYTDYFNSIRKKGLAEAEKVVELIIFYNTDLSGKAKEFVDRLYESEKIVANKDIIVFLDTWAFLTLMTKYLSMIEKTVGKVKENSLKPEDLLHPYTLRKHFNKVTDKGFNYYLVDSSALDKLYENEKN